MQCQRGVDAHLQHLVHVLAKIDEEALGRRDHHSPGLIVVVCNWGPPDPVAPISASRRGRLPIHAVICACKGSSKHIMVCMLPSSSMVLQAALGRSLNASAIPFCCAGWPCGGVNVKQSIEPISQMMGEAVGDDDEQTNVQGAYPQGGQQTGGLLQDPAQLQGRPLAAAP